MNKDIIVLLLQKDIKELSLLTAGFEQMEEFPEPILRLAGEKAANVLDRINDLANFSSKEEEVVVSAPFGSGSIIEEASAAEEEAECYGKNCFDVPLDSYLESQLDSYRAENEEMESADRFVQKTDDYAGGEFERNNTEPEVQVGGAEIAQQEMLENTAENRVEEETASPADLIEEKTEVSAKTVENKDLQPAIAVLKDKLSLEDKSLTNNLENQKIEDIRHALNIGDRFRFQRELFGGNGEQLNKTINYLNQLAKFSEAESFLKSKFGWADDNVHAEDFLQIVKRRYL